MIENTTGLGAFVGISEAPEVPVEIEVQDESAPPPPAPLPEPGHSDNLADFMDESALLRLSSQLLSDFDYDKRSREDWEKVYKAGLNKLGMETEERSQPWQGASGITHPMITEAVVRFQSNAIMEIFPETGPAKTKIIGEETQPKREKATRIKDFYNYQLTEVMSEYRKETEKLLWGVAVSGSAFRKLYTDPSMERPCARYVPAEDFVAPYGTSDLMTAPRYTHVMTVPKNTVRKLQAAGVYRDVNLIETPQIADDVKEKVDKLTKESDPGAEDYYKLLEMHVEADLEGFEDKDQDNEPTGIGLPYVVTMEMFTGTVLNIYRNWVEDDPKKKKLIHFANYDFITGPGFYGFGLIHLIGGLSKGATSILRQLIDAGTLSNLPGGLKTRGMKIHGGDTPIAPGEWRDTEVPGNKIQDAIMPLPYKEPSSVLLQLLGIIVEDGRRLGSIADIEIGDASGQAPVGTTLAIMERAMKIISAVQARLHASMKDEFKILFRIFKEKTPEDYPYDVEGATRMIKVEDFDGTVDVIPVSNPNSATMSQRVVQYQAAVQLSQQAPQLYDLSELHRNMIQVLGIPHADKIVPDKSNIPPADPITENMNIMNGKPVKAYHWQEHEAHITSHMALMQDPKIAAAIGQNPQFQTIQASFMAHVIEHLAYQYRRDMELKIGIPLPDMDKPLPGDVEGNFSFVVAAAAQKVLQKDQQEMQAREITQKQQDPIIQMQQQELQIEQQKVQQKGQETQIRAQTEAQRTAAQVQTEKERIAAQERTKAAELRAKAAENAQEFEKWRKEHELERADLRRDIAKTQADIALIAEQIKDMRRPEPGR